MNKKRIYVRPDLKVVVVDPEIVLCGSNTDEGLKGMNALPSDPGGSTNFYRNTNSIW